MEFLIIMAVGLIGLLLMAVPGMQRHGHVGAPQITPHGHAGLHIGHGPAPHSSGHALPAPHANSAHAAPSLAAGRVGQTPATGAQNVEAPAGFELMRLIPSPRAIFSILTLFGAFGYALLAIVHSWPLAALIALVPAVGIEYFAVRPLWNLMFQFQGIPTTPIEALVTCEATAVTPFRNGKGLVSVEHDGQLVQFSARLQVTQANVPVKVGDTLCIEDVDAAQQRVLVSVK